MASFFFRFKKTPNVLKLLKLGEMRALAGLVLGRLYFIVVFLPLGLSGCGGGPATVSVAVTPLARSVDGGDSTALTATVGNDSESAGVTWVVSGGGALTNTSAYGAIYNAPAPSNTALTATVTATSVTDPSKAASTAILVPAVPAIAAAALAPGAVGWLTPSRWPPPEAFYPTPGS